MTSKRDGLLCFVKLSNILWIARGLGKITVAPSNRAPIRIAYCLRDILHGTNVLFGEPFECEKTVVGRNTRSGDFHQMCQT
ncbi:hypothetical protein SKAU_G00345020 [Synaphobranchus kaupii]|uniref:Uncharacterized protein n=1 Tax=Synaphobranchus kaupii TaxID=118154 RepID=A0A9Q1IHM5_SYNKA|nr:hypothetical protein SKAU_G00345020 [Synaphobranchus kaupii]